MPMLLNENKGLLKNMIFIRSSVSYPMILLERTKQGLLSSQLLPNPSAHGLEWSNDVSHCQDVNEVAAGQLKL
jgi:hypothetical protein